MELYRGSVMKMFLIDRLAFGLPIDETLRQFKEEYREEITAEQLNEWAIGWKSDIEKREKELVEDLKQNSGTISIRVENINKITQQIIDELVKSKNYRLAEKWMGKAKDQLELLGKFYGELKEKKETVNYTIVQTSNLSALEMLEKDGIIRIMDKKRLKKLLGIVDTEMLV